MSLAWNSPSSAQSAAPDDPSFARLEARAIVCGMTRSTRSGARVASLQLLRCPAWAFVALAACTPTPSPKPTAASPRPPVPASAVASVSPPASPVRPAPSASSTVLPVELTSADRCKRDSDCVITLSPNCCSHCDPNPLAASRAAAARLRGMCTRVRCSRDRRRVCPPVADVDAYRAVCRHGRCAGVPR